MNSFDEDPSAILDALPDAVLVVDENLLVTAANHTATRILGSTQGGLRGRPVLDLVHEPDRTDATERVNQVLAGAEVAPVTLRVTNPDGRLRWVEVAGRVVSARSVDARGEVRTVRRLALVIRDVAFRVDGALESTRATARSHRLVQLAIAAQTSTPDATHGLSELGEILGAHVVDLHEVDADGMTAVLRGRWTRPRKEVARTTAPPRVRLADATVWSSPLRSDGIEHDELDLPAGALDAVDPAIEVGRVVALRVQDRVLGLLTVGWARDHQLTNSERDLVTTAGRILGAALDRVRTQQLLVASEALLRDMFRTNSAVMYLVDPTTLRIVDANEAAARFYGYSRGELVGMDLHELTSHTPEQFRLLVDRARAEAAPSVVDRHHRHADGTTFVVEVHTSRLQLPGRELELSIVQDVTGQREALRRLRQLTGTEPEDV